jgi:hypothetical protein
MFSLDSFGRRDSQPDKEAVSRHRRDSVSVADVLHRVREGVVVDPPAVRLALNARRRSTLSLCSLESSETSYGSCGTAPPQSPPTLSPTTAAKPPHRRRRHSHRSLRHSLASGPRAQPLAPHVDQATVLSISTSSSMYGQMTAHARFNSLPGGLPARDRLRLSSPTS